jgi:hypothetical protein
MAATKRPSKKGGAAKRGAKRGGGKKGGAKKGGAKKGGSRLGSVLSNIGSIASTVGSITGGRREMRVGVSSRASVNDIAGAVKKKFAELGCPGCRSGIERIVLEDIRAGGGR